MTSPMDKPAGGELPINRHFDCMHKCQQKKMDGSVCGDSCRQLADVQRTMTQAPTLAERLRKLERGNTGLLFTQNELLREAAAALEAAELRVKEVEDKYAAHLAHVAKWAGDIGEALGKPSEDFSPAALVILARQVTRDREILNEALKRAEATAAADRLLFRDVLALASGSGLIDQDNGYAGYTRWKNLCDRIAIRAAIDASQERQG